MEKKYSNKDITVVWKPDVCIHSALCWHGLLQVFDPRKRPWISMDGADTDAIIAQVEKCPSGALSWFKNGDVEVSPESVEVDTIVEAIPNGPLKVHGNIRVKDAAGNETVRQKITSFCRCGHSQNKPFCDGSHREAGFKDDQ
ncbi:MAG: (4Fe-4S)-binding protein [Saprospiraceae bacterium]|nr:(4Fe-4S)-binding protein [Saprospiraceae bacterium]